MTTAAQRPTEASAISDLRLRVSKLERLLSDALGAGRLDTIFVLSGGLYESTSPPYPPPQRRKYWEAQIEIGTWSAPTAPIVVELIVGGATVKTLEIPAGSISTTFPLSVNVARNTRLQVAIDGAGGDARDICISLRF